MADFLNILFALASISLGCFGWLRPVFTMTALDLAQIGDSTMGHSEVRASVGCLFVGLGLGALALGGPAAYAMIGFTWAGAAVGRATSLVLDGQSRKKWVYFWVEAVVAVLALAINLPALLA